MSVDPSSRLYFDDAVVDRAAMLVTKAGRRVDLEPKAFDVLVYLVDRPGSLVTKAELIESIWKGVAVTDHVLTRVIGQLRRTLGDDAREARYIETVPTRGYRFIGAVSGAPRDHVAPASLLPAPVNMAPVITAPDAPPVARPARLARQILWVSLVAVVAGAGGWMAAHRGVAPAEWQEPPPAARQLTFAQALDVYPDFSPDGRFLAYATSASGAFELEVRPIARDARTQRVTADGQGSIQPDFSPDGQQLAYHSMQAGGIWTVPSLGGVSRRLAPVGASPAWSPDGRLIAFQSGEPSTVEVGGTPPPSRLLVLDLASGKQRPLTWIGHPFGGHTEPAWSPDGRRVAFVVRAVSQTEIWSTAIDGGEPTRLWLCPRGCSRVAYEPSSRGLISSVRGQGYFRLPLDPSTGAVGGVPELLVAQRADAAGHIAVSADGQSVAFTELTSRSNLYGLSLDADGGRVGDPVAITSSTGRTMTPAFSPDGTRIAFGARRETTQICLVPSTGGEVTPLPLTNGLTAAFRPYWTPAGGLLAVGTGPAGSMIVSIDPESRETRVLAPLSSSDVKGNAQFLAPSFTSDGRQAVFAREDEQGVALWTMDLASRAERRLTESRENAVFPTPSPDGRWIAYEQVVDEGMHAAIMPASGGPGRRLTAGRGLTWPHSWSSDGQRIYVAVRRGGAWSIGYLSRDTGALTLLTTQSVPNGYLRYPAVSPSGDRVVYEQTETTGNIWQIPLWSESSRRTAPADATLARVNSRGYR